MTYATGLRCVHCEAQYPLESMFEGCPACADNDFASGVTTTYDLDALRTTLGDGPLAGPGDGIWRYAALLPVVEGSHRLSLGEGGTALVAMPALARELGVAELWVKDESRNPTWSFKDRHAAVTIGKALDAGATTVILSTSGNHGAAVAAYAARAGLRCVALTYPGLPLSGLAQIRAYGADIFITSREGRWAIVRDAVRTHGWYPASTFTEIPTNPAFGHDGYKTIAYEIQDQLAGELPDLVAVPTSYGEGLFGIWKGFVELEALGRASSRPRMMACEPAQAAVGAAHRARLEGQDGGRSARVPTRTTVARGVGSTVSSYIGVVALRDSDGLAVNVEDGAIVAAQADLAHHGLFVELASAVGLAGLREAARRGDLRRTDRVVLVNTSGGLKNLNGAADRYLEPSTIAGTLEALASAMATTSEGSH